MSKIRSIVATQSSVGEPERRGDETVTAARLTSPTFRRPQTSRFVPFDPIMERPFLSAARRS